MDVTKKRDDGCIDVIFSFTRVSYQSNCIHTFQNQIMMWSAFQTQEIIDRWCVVAWGYIFVFVFMTCKVCVKVWRVSCLIWAVQVSQTLCLCDKNQTTSTGSLTGKQVWVFWYVDVRKNPGLFRVLLSLNIGVSDTHTHTHTHTYAAGFIVAPTGPMNRSTGCASLWVLKCKVRGTHTHTHAARWKKRARGNIKQASTWKKVEKWF